MTKWRHSGDYGDCIQSLKIIQSAGDPHNAYYLVDRPGITHPMSPRCKPLIALIEVQPYISECRMGEDRVDVDFVSFRNHHRATQTLARSHLIHYGIESGRAIEMDDEPWLFAEADENFRGKVVINKTARYGNQYFPWRQIVKHYGNRLVFLGTPDEHRAFVNTNGWAVHQPTQTLLEAARIIKGSDLFIGNQSVCMNIALGLGHPFIQETCLEQPDCIFYRPQGQYVTLGGVTLPDIDGSGELVIPEIFYIGPPPNTSVIPPGGWQYGGGSSGHFDSLAQQIAKVESLTLEEAKHKLLEFNMRRIPDYFRAYGNAPTKLFDEAFHSCYSKSLKIQ